MRIYSAVELGVLLGIAIILTVAAWLLVRILGEIRDEISGAKEVLELNIWDERRDTQKVVPDEPTDPPPSGRPKK